MARRGKTKGPARLLASAPQLWSVCIHYWEAYQRLTTCRQMNMGGPGAIPWTAIDAYATRYQYVGPDYDALLYYVELLDGIYLQSQASPDRPRGKRPPKGKK